MKVPWWAYKRYNCGYKMFATFFAWGVFIVFHKCVAHPLFCAGFCFCVGNWLPLHAVPLVFGV